MLPGSQFPERLSGRDRSVRSADTPGVSTVFPAPRSPRDCLITSPPYCSPQTNLRMSHVCDSRGILENIPDAVWDINIQAKSNQVHCKGRLCWRLRLSSYPYNTPPCPLSHDIHVYGICAFLQSWSDPKEVHLLPTPQTYPDLVL